MKDDWFKFETKPPMWFHEHTGDAMPVDEYTEILFKEMTMDELERMAFNMICNKIDELIRISNAKKCVYIAIDGVPGMCKQAQQRQRRFKSSKTIRNNCPYSIFACCNSSHIFDLFTSNIF